MKFDVETLIEGIVDHLKAKLSAKLAEIDTEKNDGIILTPVPADAYTTFGLPDSILNFEPFIMVTEDALPPESIGSDTAQKYEVFVSVVTRDTGNDPNVGKRLRRYTRAIVEIFEEAHLKFGYTTSLEVQGLTPRTYKLRNGRNYHFAGVTLGVEIA